MSDFTNTVSTVVPGFGTPSQRQASIDNNQAAGSSNYTLTFSPGIRKGMARLRTKGSITVPPTAPTTGVTTTSLVVTASNGLVTYIINTDLGGIGTANQTLDRLMPFNLDISATSFVATLVTTAGAVFVDFEVSGGG